MAFSPRVTSMISLGVYYITGEKKTDLHGPKWPHVHTSKDIIRFLVYKVYKIYGYILPRNNPSVT